MPGVSLITFKFIYILFFILLYGKLLKNPLFYQNKFRFIIASTYSRWRYLFPWKDSSVTKYRWICAFGSIIPYALQSIEGTFQDEGRAGENWIEKIQFFCILWFVHNILFLLRWREMITYPEAKSPVIINRNFSIILPLLLLEKGSLPS